MIPERARGKGDDQEKVLKVSNFNPGEGGRRLSINLFPMGSKYRVPVTYYLPSLFSIKEKQALSTSSVKDCAEFGTKKLILLKKTLRNGSIK